MFSLMIGIQLLSAQDQPNVTTVKAGTVAWNEKTHDFGQIVLNKPATAVFIFKNTSDKPVVITTAKSSCGCTVAEYTKEPVKPGDEGQVKATYNSAREGSFSKSVTVTFDGNPTPDVLTLKGEVKAKPAEQQ